MLHAILRGVPSCLQLGCDCGACPHPERGHCNTCANGCHENCGPRAALKRKLRVVK